MVTGPRPGAAPGLWALALCPALASCGEPTIASQRAESPDHRYVATVEYDAPVLENRDTYIVLRSRRPFTRHIIYRTHLRDCVALRWTGPTALTVDRLADVQTVMETHWTPRWGGEPVRITYRNITLGATPVPAECMESR